jgi:hypothetical protein
MVMRNNGRQKGAVILTVAFALLFLLGFMAIALDFGHMFVVKDELQTSMDACALAAAQELDAASDAITRATNAGMTAGNLNNVNFQSATWSGKGKIVAANITFKDAAYGVTAVAANARYAQCQHSQNGIQMWLFQAMGAFSGSGDPAFSNTKNVGALAVATRASAQSTCPVPLAIKPKVGGVAPNYGYQVGEWVNMIGKSNVSNGEMGWYNLDGSNNANETRNELAEPARCGTKVGDTLGTPGAQTTVDTVWNYRFGIYKNADYDPSTNHPDYTGYAYTAQNWKNAVPQNAFSGIKAAGSHATAANFLTKRLAFASYDDTGTSINGGDAITGLNTNSFKKLATPGPGTGALHEHNQYGYSRRIVTVPVINGATQVIDYLCMFMLQPLSGPNAIVQLEFRGNAGNVSSPCTTSGLAGGTVGPKVPVLVQ